MSVGRIPLLAEEGWTRHEENVPLPIWRGRGGQFGEIFRPEHFAKLTTPSAALRWLRDFLLMPQPPSSARRGMRPHAPHYCVTAMSVLDSSWRGEATAGSVFAWPGRLSLSRK